MANSVDPDQTAPSVAVWSGSALFAYVILSGTLVFEILGHLPYLSQVPQWNITDEYPQRINIILWANKKNINNFVIKKRVYKSRAV